MSNTKKYPCPVCGKLEREEEEYSYHICTACGWEEDGYQQHEPDDEAGPNDGWSLNAAIKAWKEGETLFEGWPNPNAKK